MELANLFKSSKEIEREKKRAQRAMEREVEHAIERNTDRIRTIEQERVKTWEKAKTLLASGQKTEAARLTQIYKAQGLRISKLERMKTYAQNKLDEFAGAADMQNVAKALKNLVNVLNLDPDDFEEDLGDVGDAGEDIKDMNKAMDKAYNQDQKNMIAEAEAEKGNSVGDEELMAALENEVAASVRGDKIADLSTPGKNASVDDISAGRDRLKALLEKK